MPNLIITEPKPLQEIGAKFNIVGIVPKSWLKTTWGTFDNSISIEYLDLECKTFMATTLYVQQPSTLIRRFMGMYEINQTEQLHSHNIGWIEKSSGRIVLKIYAYHKKGSKPLFIPLIVPQFIPDGPIRPEIVTKHLNVEKHLRQIEEDLKKYGNELNELWEKEGKDFDTNFTEDSNEWIEVGDDERLDGIACMLYNAESDAKRVLDEKYKEVLDWRGPLARGIAGRMNGYVFKVYSHDHGSHFHVVHRERRVDARFSFPEIQLIDYKNKRNLIGSREVKNIQEFFNDQKNFKRLEDEFKKRAPCNN